jgi:uncharacterized protein (TIGR03066 family)
MRALSAIVLGAAVLGLAGPAATQEKDDFAKKIVGRWKVTETKTDAPVGMVVEFTRDGKLTLAATVDGKEHKAEGTYSVEKDKLRYKLRLADQTVEEAETIKKLTDDALELEDKDKKGTTLKKEK